jgi:hypothetical protein
MGVLTVGVITVGGSYSGCQKNLGAYCRRGGVNENTRAIPPQHFCSTGDTVGSPSELITYDPSTPCFFSIHPTTSIDAYSSTERTCVPKVDHLILDSEERRPLLWPRAESFPLFPETPRH